MGGVDQLLFGYRDGHALIAGSRQLSPTQMLDVLPHVDAAVEHRDERQLVGIWIPSLAGYLLARIWAAPERPRPGAVWTHALVLTLEQIDGGRLDGLSSLFRRPGENGVIGSYDEPLPWPSGSAPALPPPRLARALAVAVGAGDNRPRVVLWPAPAQAEDALLVLLDRLSGRMRRWLSFRTREHVRSDRSPYRVQVASSLRDRRTAADAIVLDAREPVQADAWARG